MPNIYLPLAALFFSVLLIVMFFVKERLISPESKIFSLMLVITFFDSVFSSLLYYNIYTEYEPVMVRIFGKIDFAMLIIWLSCFFLYTVVMTRKTDEKIKDYFKYLIGSIVIIDLAVIYLIYYGNLSVSLINVINLPISGSSVNIFYLISGVYLFLTFMILMLNLYQIAKKGRPLLICLGFSILLFILAWNYPDLVLLQVGLTFINAIMYLTIENPDIKKMQASEKAKEEAEKANFTKSEFLSSMSHEIRTSLNAVKAYSELTAEANDLAEAKENAIETVKSVDGLLKTINDVLDISYLETNNLEIINNNYDPMVLFNNVCLLMNERIKEKGVFFKVNISPEVPTLLYGDYNQIQKILINLLSNAVKYTDAGYISLMIACQNENDNCALTITVEDTGCGIRPEEINTLFTFSRNQIHGDFSFGLVIVQRIVALLEGTITVQSIWGAGSKFTVSLKQLIQNSKANPLSAFNPELALINDENTRVNRIRKKDFTGKKILLVDDNKTNLKVAKKILKDYQLTIIQSLSGADALAKVNAGEKFDLIFLDDLMPEMTGTEVMHELKRQGYPLPIVVLTANDLSGEKTKYLTIGFDDYLSKPIERRELDKVLNKYLK